MADLKGRLEAALYEADLFGVAQAPTPERIAHVVLHELEKLAEEWDEEAREFYYANRHSGPIEYAAGFEEGWQHAAHLLRSGALPPTTRSWT